MQLRLTALLVILLLTGRCPYELPCVLYSISNSASCLWCVHFVSGLHDCIAAAVTKKAT